MGLPSKEEVQFVRQVSAQTGIDPGVLFAWVELEGADAPGGTGHYNYLNLRPYRGDPYRSVSSGGFEQFGTVQQSIVATVRRLRQPFARGILSTAHSHATPQDQIAAIAASNWDAGHYGGVGGPNLARQYAQLQLGQGFGSGGGVGGAVSGAAGAVGGAISGAADAVVSPITAPFNAVKDAVEFVFSQRFLEVVGGFLLLLLGLYLLGRQFGMSAPIPVAPAVADASPFQSPPGAGSDAHYAESRSYTGGRAPRRESIRSEPTPVYSSR